MWDALDCLECNMCFRRVQYVLQKPGGAHIQICQTGSLLNTSRLLSNRCRHRWWMHPTSEISAKNQADCLTPVRHHNHYGAICIAIINVLNKQTMPEARWRADLLVDVDLIARLNKWRPATVALSIWIFHAAILQKIHEVRILFWECWNRFEPIGTVLQSKAKKNASWGDLIKCINSVYFVRKNKGLKKSSIVVAAAFFLFYLFDLENNGAQY